MRKYRILIADDDPWILRMVSVALEEEGYIIDSACDGKEALQLAMASTPDLVITDVMMPDMDGWALIESLRSRAELAVVPFVFLTSLGSDSDRSRGLRLGASDYLCKPFSFERLSARIAEIFDRSQPSDRKMAPLGPHLNGVSPAAVPNAKPDFSGNIREVSIASLLVLMDMERKSGVLTIDSGTANGRIGARRVEVFLQQGRPIAATLLNPRNRADKPVNNELAIYEALSWTDGTFAFQFKEIDRAPEIEMTTNGLLLECARRTDENENENVIEFDSF